MLWIKADEDILEGRIRRRVDKMIDQENGLDEVFHVFNQFTSGDINVQLDFTKGILQSIGYKEFYEYWKALKEEKEEPTLEMAKEKLVNSTVQYAKYQAKWLRKRFLPIFKPDIENKQNLMH